MKGYSLGRFSRDSAICRSANSRFGQISMHRLRKFNALYEKYIANN